MLRVGSAVVYEEKVFSVDWLDEKGDNLLITNSTESHSSVSKYDVQAIKIADEDSLLPSGKFPLWTVSYINTKDYMVMMEPESKQDAINLLRELKEEGQDMAYVNVYPPKSNLTYEELLTYKEKDKSST